MGKLLQVTVSASEGLAADLLVVGAFVDGPAAETAALTPAMARHVRAGVPSAWKAEPGRRLHAAGSADVRRVLILGLGERARLGGDELAAWARRALAAARDDGERVLAVAVPDHPAAREPGSAARLLRELALGGYRFDEFRSESEPANLRTVRVLAPAAGATALRRARRELGAVAGGVALARDLGNTPPNRATPAWMAARARSLASAHGLEATVLGPKELTARGMGGVLAVGGGSANTPRLVRLRYGDRGPAIALVGKGVTFDTGGISLKPGKAMDEMKYDKCGACAVLGAVRAVADLELPVRLTAYVPLAENMPDGRAYRPGDIVRCYSGKTVEILNTDAEGRMILADALAWAAEESPDALVEISTLTGATVVALGHHGAALYSPSDELADDLLRAGAESGDRLWRMPLWKEAAEAIRGHHGDLKNVGGRWGGANAAAAFLAEFTGGVERWAHLDVAGTAWVGADGDGPAGATGFGVALLARWIADRAAAT